MQILKLLKVARKIVLAHREVSYLNEILTMHIGPEYVLTNLSVEFRDIAAGGDIEETVEQIDRSIKKRYGDLKCVFIEAEAQRHRANS